jgi:hypothetical protein
MVKRRANLFEHVFEDYLRKRALPYIIAAEEKRPLVDGRTVKNLDFIVTTPRKEHALIDVKGKRHPAVGGKRRSWWENWVPAGDVEALEFWEKCFGRAFMGLFVFIYELGDSDRASDFKVIHSFGGADYGLVGIPASIYGEHMKVRSARWNTRSIPTKLFRSLVRPITEFL